MPEPTTLGEACVVLFTKPNDPLRGVSLREHQLGGAGLGERTGLTSRLVRDRFAAGVFDLMRFEGVDTTAARIGAARPDRRVTLRATGRPCSIA